jgi:hypothetical protein
MHKNPDIVQEIKIISRDWFGYLVRMETRIMVKVQFVGNPGGKKRQERPRN